MGRRARQREQRAATPVHESRDRMVRVVVSDETWAAFRANLGGVPAGRAVGRLIEREVASNRRRTAMDEESVRYAVGEARVVARELQALAERLEAAQRREAPAPSVATASEPLLN